MSHIPPGGNPPPYGYGHHGPPAPAPGAYTYMPTPVMMPMPVYPPQQPTYPHNPHPTYVTNHIYQQPPPDPVQVVENAPPAVSYQPQDFIDWVPTTPQAAANLSHRAVVAGKEGWDGSPLWVIRAHHNGDLVPGKLAVKHRNAYIPFACKEIPVHNIEVLCAPQYLVRWLPAAKGQVPVGAIPAGNSRGGETLYIGRTAHKRSITPGKVHPTHGCLYISYGGTEVSYKHYEVLCKVVG